MYWKAVCTIYWRTHSMYILHFYANIPCKFCCLFAHCSQIFSLKLMYVRTFYFIFSLFWLCCTSILGSMPTFFLKILMPALYPCLLMIFACFLYILHSIILPHVTVLMVTTPFLMRSIIKIIYFDLNEKLGTTQLNFFKIMKFWPA